MITRDAVVYLVLGGGSGQVFGKHGALPGGCIPHGGGAVFVVAFGNAAAERPVVAGQGVIEVAVADDTAVCVGVAVIIVDFLRRGDDGAIIDLVPLGGGALVGGKVITPDLHGGIIIVIRIGVPFGMGKIQLAAAGTDQIDESNLPRAAAPVFKTVQLVKRLHIAGCFRNGQQHGGHGGVAVVVSG